jgi:hypothetical protein
MKIEELRIGNYVTIIPHKENDVMKIDCEDFKNLLEFKTFDRLKPIPLNEEKLLKLGFKEKDFEDGKIITVIENNKCIGFIINNLSSMVILKSVHQLQNLYFALNNKELTL